MGRATGEPTTTSLNKPKLILIFLKFEIKQFKHVCAFQFLIKYKQAMIKFRGMAEHRFSNVCNYQCLMWILTFPLIPFPSYLLFIFQKTRCMNCNLLENKNGQFLTGFYAKSSIRSKLMRIHILDLP